MNHDTPTLRDQFAMAALTGLSALPENWTNDGGRTINYRSPGYYAKRAYEIADAMLTARKETEQSQERADG